MADRAAVFVLPTSTAGQQGPVAAWVSTAGWAAAARRLLGDAWIVTPEGLVTPDEARRRGSDRAFAAPNSTSFRRRVPPVAKTAVKDVREHVRARRFRVPNDGPWRDRDIAFIWQRHELFHSAGIDLAQRLNVPSVLFVPATLVWQSEQWHVKRPGTARLVERLGEAPALRAATLVACGSDEVAEQAERLGAHSNRILVTPTGVDLDSFAGPFDRKGLRRELELERHFVVGWVGSFRSFHGLEVLVAAVAEVEGAALLLVGDGPERAGIEELTRRAGVTAVCTGTVPHTEVPKYLATMDAAVVVARAGAPFHYSPLKLAEYLAAGVPTVAPRVPQLEASLNDGHEAHLVEPGDTRSLARALNRLHDEPETRAVLAAAGRTAAKALWSWDHQVQVILDRIG